MASQLTARVVDAAHVGPAGLARQPSADPVGGTEAQPGRGLPTGRGHHSHARVGRRSADPGRAEGRSSGTSCLCTRGSRGPPRPGRAELRCRHPLRPPARSSGLLALPVLRSSRCLARRPARVLLRPSLLGSLVAALRRARRRDGLARPPRCRYRWRPWNRASSSLQLRTLLPPVSPPRSLAHWHPGLPQRIWARGSSLRSQVRLAAPCGRRSRCSGSASLQARCRLTGRCSGA